MRWDQLFDDLEAQLRATELLDLQPEVADRTRRERAAVTLMDRLAAGLDASVRLHVAGLGSARTGRLVELGKDWLLLEGTRAPEVVALSAVVAVEGLPMRHDDRPGVSRRRFGLGVVLRELSRDRSPVRVLDTQGGQHEGTLDVVGADYVELALHEADVPRRAAATRGRRLVPFGRVAVVQTLG